MIASRQLLCVVALYAAIQSCWLLTIPPFEGPDEFQHYDFVRYVAITGHLPDRIPSVVNEGDFFTGEWTQESAYYWLLGLILRPTGYQTMRPGEALVGNKHSMWLGGQAANLHQHAAPLPYPIAGGLLIGRLASVLFGLGTLVSVFAAVRLVTADDQIAALASSCVALVPQFGYQHVLITNDTAATMWASIASALIVWLLVRREPPSWPLGLAIGATTGLAIATKLTAGVIIVALPMAWWCRRNDGRQAWLRPAIAWVAGLLATAGVAFGRNWIIFGDPLATALKHAVVAQFDFRTVFNPRELSSYGHLLYMLFRGTWASFGWGPWTPHQFWILTIFSVMSVFLLLCVILALRQRRTDTTAVMLSVFALHCTAFLISISFFAGYSARYFLPLIVPFVVIVVAGAPRVCGMVRRRVGAEALRWILVAVPMLLAAAWIGTLTATIIAFHFEGLR